MSWFLIPIETVIRGGKEVRQERYVPALGVDRSIIDFGETAIVWANCSPAQEMSVAANADVRQIPALDNTVAVNATKQALEDLNVPGQWVTAGMTYRQVLRVVVGMAQLVQYVTGVLGQQLTIAGHLNDTFNSFPVAVRNALTSAAAQFGVDTSGLNGASTLREILRNFGQQCAAGLIDIRLGDL